MASTKATKGQSVGVIKTNQCHNSGLQYIKVQPGLSKVAGCRWKLPPTWLVLAGYSA